MFAAVVCRGADKRGDYLRALQTDAVRTGKATWGNWGPHGLKYSEWLNHSNRLIPVYSFGMNLSDVAGEKSSYRDADRLRTLYGFLPRGTVNRTAVYFDQTDIYRLQKLAAERGKSASFYSSSTAWTGGPRTPPQSTRAARSATTKAAARDEIAGLPGHANRLGYMVTSPHDAGEGGHQQADYHAFGAGARRLRLVAGGRDAVVGWREPLYLIPEQTQASRHGFGCVGNFDDYRHQDL